MIGKFHKWGDVDGDREADAILSDRNLIMTVMAWLNISGWVIVIALAVWYGNDGGPKVLAALILFAAIAV